MFHGQRLTCAIIEVDREANDNTIGGFSRAVDQRGSQSAAMCIAVTDAVSTGTGPNGHVERTDALGIVLHRPPGFPRTRFCETAPLTLASLTTLTPETTSAKRHHLQNGQSAFEMAVL